MITALLHLLLPVLLYWKTIHPIMLRMPISPHREAHALVRIHHTHGFLQLERVCILFEVLSFSSSATQCTLCRHSFALLLPCTCKQLSFKRHFNKNEKDLILLKF